MLEHALISAQSLQNLLTESVPLIVLPLAVVQVEAVRVELDAVAVVLVICELADVSYHRFQVFELAKTVPLPVLKLSCILEACTVEETLAVIFTFNKFTFVILRYLRLMVIRVKFAPSVVHAFFDISIILRSFLVVASLTNVADWQIYDFAAIELDLCDL